MNHYPYPNLQDALLSNRDTLGGWFAALIAGKTLPFVHDGLLITLSSSLCFHTEGVNTPLMLVGVENTGMLVLPPMEEGSTVNRFKLITAGCNEELAELVSSFFDVLAVYAKKSSTTATTIENNE